MKADQLWKHSTGKGMTIAVLDTGVDGSRSELRGQVLNGKDFSYDPKGADFDTNGHGTEMAALIAGKGGSHGIQGLAPGSKVLPVRVNPGKAVLGDGTPALLKGIRYAIQRGARIINLSETITGYLTQSAKERLRTGVDEINSSGALIFAGAGNDGESSNIPGYPSVLPGVVGVGSVNQSGTVSKFSTHGPQVALAAPGEGIPARCKVEGASCTESGTSHATALTSASAALIWSAHPKWTANQVLRVMMQTASKPKGRIPSEYIGHGVIRPAQVLLDGKGDPGVADVNPLFPKYRPGKSSAASPSSPSKADATSGTADTQVEAPAASAAGGDDDNDNTLVYAGVGVAAALALSGGFVVARKRRRV
jgi:type VII secretion-associated serine protease mycosin